MAKINTQFNFERILGQFPTEKPIAHTILVVDDEPMARNLLRLMLVRDGFDVREAANGDDALSMIESKQPDLIVLDVMMPGMDGLTVCEQIRERPEGGDVPIIMLSARTDSESIRLGKEAGATEYLSKPISADKLTHHVREILTPSTVAI